MRINPDEDEEIVDAHYEIPSTSANGKSAFFFPVCKRPSSLISILFLLVIVLLVLLATTVAVAVVSWRRSSLMTTTSTTTSSPPPRISAKLNNATLPQWKSLPDTTQVLTKIAFGSCSTQEMPQPHWDTISNPYAFGADLFILAGDNVYGDCLKDETCFPLREAYMKMAQHASVQGAALLVPVYAALLVPVYATLDDHDYGMNDCHADNPYKETARELFAEFFNIPWSEFEQKDGVYRSQIWGDTSAAAAADTDTGNDVVDDNNNRRLQIILLDTRYARSPFNETGLPDSPYTPYTMDDDNSNSNNWKILSDKQWEWLETELQKPAELRLLVSSIQVLRDGSHYEAWRQIPSEQERLLNLIQNKSVVLLSGDVHRGGFYEKPDRNSTNNKTSFMELISSSLTHTVPTGTDFDCASEAICDVAPDATRVGDGIYQNNFGSVEIDWNARSFTLALRRTETSFGSYSTKQNNDTMLPIVQHPHTLRTGNSNHILRAKTYSFPF